MEYIVKQVPVEAILGIRSVELLKGVDPEACRFAEDNDKDAVHLGLFYQEEVIGCVSIFKRFKENFKEENQHQYRGMAVTKAYQGNSIGNLLLSKADQVVKHRAANFIWLNARVVALNFYRRNGYTIEGVEFDIPRVGKHYLMYKQL